MSENRARYGSSSQPITISLNGLANGAARQATEVSNATDLFFDAHVEVVIASNATGVSSSGFVSVFAAGSVNGGSTYNGGASGADGPYTADELNLKFLGTIAVNAVNQTFRGSFNVAAAFGRFLPEWWTLVVRNQSGADLAGSGNSATYQGLGAQIVG